MDDILKTATAHKRSGHIDLAIDLLRSSVHRSADLAQVGPVYKKLVNYLVSASRMEEALAAADELVARSESTIASSPPELQGTVLHAAYLLRSEVRAGVPGLRTGAFFDEALASWHWRDAMRKQRRIREFPKADDVANLSESARSAGVAMKAADLRKAISAGLDAGTSKDWMCFLRTLFPASP